MKCVRVGVLFALLAFGAAYADIAAGDRFTDEGKFERAALEYQQVLEQGESAEALYKLARAETYRAETLSDERAVALYEEAIGHARRAVELAPEEAEAHFELARAYGRLAQFRGVLESLDLADRIRDELGATLTLEPDHDAALHALALWHLNVPWLLGGRTSEVHRLFARAIELNPTRVTHYVVYAEALLELGDPQGAKARLEQAQKITPKNYSDRQALQKAARLFQRLP